jgi:hypothetical protein
MVCNAMQSYPDVSGAFIGSAIADSKAAWPHIKSCLSDFISPDALIPDDEQAEDELFFALLALELHFLPRIVRNPERTEIVRQSCTDYFTKAKDAAQRLAKWVDATKRTDCFIDAPMGGVVDLLLRSWLAEQSVDPVSHIVQTALLEPMTQLLLMRKQKIAAILQSGNHYEK